jgi:hypothetical protein
MGSFQRKRIVVALLGALAFAAGALAWLALPSPWWMNPDFTALHEQLQRCESPFAERRPCEIARVMAGHAVDALHACVGDPAETDGCHTVKRVAASQANSLQRLVHMASTQPPTRLWVVGGFSLNPWLLAARSPFHSDWQINGGWPLAWLGMAGFCVLAMRIGYLGVVWLGQASRFRALRSDVDDAEQALRQLERQVDWLNALQSRLRALQRAQHAGLLPLANSATGPAQTGLPALRTRLDAAFGAQPPIATNRPNHPATAGDGTWHELDPPALHTDAPGPRRLLHLATGLVLRVACHRSDSQGGGGGFWEFAVQLDAVEAGLPHPRPIELSAEFLRWDWVAVVQDDEIAADDWPVALAAGRAWLQAVLRGEVEVENGTLSSHVDRRLRGQLSAARRTKERKASEMRALRDELGMGWYAWCWQRLLRRQPRVQDAAFDAHERSA